MKCCIYNGMEFKSIKELARDLGISYIVLLERVNCGTSLHDAVTKALFDKKLKEERLSRKSTVTKAVKHRIFRFPLVYDDVPFNSIDELADYYAVNAKTLASRLANGWTLEDSLVQPKNVLEFPRTYKGVEYTSITALAFAYDIGWSKLYGRLKKGLPLEEALKPEHRRICQDYKNIVIFGKPYKSLNEVAKAFGLSRNTVKDRLDSGLSYEESVVKGRIR